MVWFENIYNKIGWPVLNIWVMKVIYCVKKCVIAYSMPLPNLLQNLLGNYIISYYKYTIILKWKIWQVL